MTSTHTHLASLAFALSVGLSACDKEPVPEAASTQVETEAGVMADDAVGLAEAALDNAAMSDGPMSAPASERQAGGSSPDLSSVVEAEVDTDTDDASGR